MGSAHDAVLKALKGGSWKSVPEICKLLKMTQKHQSTNVSNTLNSLYDKWDLVEKRVLPQWVGEHNKGGYKTQWRLKPKAAEA